MEQVVCLFHIHRPAGQRTCNMGSIISKIADEIALHGSYEKYLEQLRNELKASFHNPPDPIVWRAQVPPMRNAPPPPPPGRLIKEGGAVVRKPEPGRPTPDLLRSKTHYLKTLPGPFRAVRLREKKAEMRFNDRKFRVGDVLVLREFDARTGQCTGDEEVRRITHVLEGGQFGIETGYVMLSMTDFFKP